MTMRQRRSQQAVGVLLAGSMILVTGCSNSSDDDPTSRSTVDPAGAVEGPTTTPESLAGLVLVSNVTVNADDVERYETSADQAEVTESRGRPERFVLQFLPTDGAATIRQEAWYYDEIGLRLTFDDGVLSGMRTGTPIELDGLASTPYDPQMFTAGMTLEELLAVTGENGYARQDVDLAVATDGELIFITGAVAGFDAGRLAYVETIPISPA